MPHDHLSWIAVFACRLSLPQQAGVPGKRRICAGWGEKQGSALICASRMPRDLSRRILTVDGGKAKGSKRNLRAGKAAYWLYNQQQLVCELIWN
jgi:hypothetical protein